LAQEIPADLLLTDDRKARAAASRLGIKSVGLLAVLIQAKTQGRIGSVSAAIDAIEKKGGLYLSEAAKTEARTLAGEQ